MNEEYQEIDLRKLFAKILGRWWLILLLMIVAGGASYFYTTEFVTPVYEAKSTLFIGKESDMIAGIDLNDFKIDNQLIVDYQELIKTRLVTEAVIKDLALVASTADLTDNLGITTITESRFMHITYKDHVAERAAIITNELSAVLADKAEEIVGVQNVRIVDEAIVPTNPVSPSLMKNVAIAAILGAMIALFIVFIEMAMDNRVDSEEDIEAILGALVLGAIPEFKGEERKS